MIQEFESRHFDVNFAEDDSFNCSFAEDEEFVVDFGAGIEKEYHGVYEVTPSASVQTLQTTNRVLTDNIVINPIPNNYGLITYNGSFITVS